MKHFENNVNTAEDTQQAMDFDDETGEVWDE